MERFKRFKRFAIYFNTGGLTVPDVMRSNNDDSNHGTQAVAVDSTSRIAAMVLFGLGCMDLFRGLAHTFMIHWANDTFAHLDLSVNGGDQLMLLGAFGISNWLTGMLFILIALKAKPLASATLSIILIAYGVGVLGLKFAGVSPQADFYGRFIMFGYFAVCFMGIVWQQLANKRQRQRAARSST